MVISRKLAGLVLSVVSVWGLGSAAHAAGSIEGQGQFELIAGRPPMGYQRLYEWDLFLSPADASMPGISRRLGAPPGQMPTGDGFYRIDNLPAGTYSVYVNQPDFFASPKVIPNVVIANGQTLRLDVNLDIDYSTYFRADNEWTDWQWTWYQTFKATGTGVRGVTWKMAGWGLYNGKQARITILEDNGNPDVRSWTPIGTGTDGQLASDSDEWVRWPSGTIPLTPGGMYAVKIWVDGGCAVFKRNKDGNSYPYGRAYDQDGNAKNFDLNTTVFVDKDNQIVTHTRVAPGPGVLGTSGMRWCQTFVARGEALAAVDLFAASSEADITLTCRIRRDGPDGPQVGPTKIAAGAYFASSTDLVGVSYNPDQAPLVPGQVYCIEFTDSQSFTPFFQESWSRYGDGAAYNGSAITAEDLAMTIVEYSKGPAPRMADVNGDQRVDFADYAQIAQKIDWRGPAGGIVEDLIRDGVVDWRDVAFLARTWLDAIAQLPMVVILSPVNGASFTTRDLITITAAAADADGEVVRVEFFANTNAIGTDDNGSDGWTAATGLNAGQYALTAKATDNDGGVEVSEPVNITVTTVPR